MDTPNLALVLTQAGDYRLDVAAGGSATSVRVHTGVAGAYGEDASHRISAGQDFRFYGTGLAELDARSPHTTKLAEISETIDQQCETNFGYFVKRMM